MNTPAHVLIGMAAMTRRENRRTIGAALAGALAPDLSLYVMAGASLFVLGIPAQVVFDELYFSDAWQTVFAIDNSFFLWLALFAIGFWRKSAALLAFAGAGLLHLALDFPLHHDDGRAHFQPLTGWVFESPVSYWDSGHFAGWVAPFAVVAAISAATVLWQRHRSHPWVLLIIAVCLPLELWVARQWILFF